MCRVAARQLPGIERSKDPVLSKAALTTSLKNTVSLHWRPQSRGTASSQVKGR